MKRPPCLDGIANDDAEQAPAALSKPVECWECWATVTFSLHEESPDPRTRVIAVDGELDASTSGRLSAAIQHAVDSGATHVVVDLAETTFLDSTALAGLLHCARVLRRPDRALAVVASHHGQPRGRMSITGSGHVLNVCDTRDEALALVDRPPAPPPARTPVRFSLFVDAPSAHARHAIDELNAMCRAYLPGAEVEVVDINSAADSLEREHIIASPTLVRTSPAPVRRIIGDLSDHDQVLHALGLQPMRGNNTGPY